MADLKVETSVLRDAGRSLRAVYNEFKEADNAASPGRDVIAHNKLRDRLDEFADNWDDRRKEMQSSIEGLGESAEAAADAYEQLETEFVKNLEGKG